MIEQALLIKISLSSGMSSMCYIYSPVGGGTKFMHHFGIFYLTTLSKLLKPGISYRILMLPNNKMMDLLMVTFFCAKIKP
jgi:hypothetical protein